MTIILVTIFFNLQVKISNSYVNNLNKRIISRSKIPFILITINRGHVRSHTRIREFYSIYIFNFIQNIKIKLL